MKTLLENLRISKRTTKKIEITNTFISYEDKNHPLINDPLLSSYWKTENIFVSTQNLQKQWIQSKFVAQNCTCPKEDQKAS